MTRLGGGVVRSKERVAGHAGETVVAVIAVLIRVAGRGGAYRPPATHWSR